MPFAEWHIVTNLLTEWMINIRKTEVSYFVLLSEMQDNLPLRNTAKRK